MPKFVAFCATATILVGLAAAATYETAPPDPPPPTA